MSHDIKEVPIDEIRFGQYQDRWPGMQESRGISKLAESIRQEGLHQPIGVVVLRHPEFMYDLSYGHRRLAAHKQLGLTSIHAVIYTDQKEAALATLTENAQRESLSPIEEAHSFRRSMNAGFTQTEIANTIGKTQSYVAQKLRLERLPRGVHAQLQLGYIKEGHARQLLPSGQDHWQLLEEQSAFGK
jgi:ParB family chromosome partitioning protein